MLWPCLQRLWAEVEDKNKKLAQLTKERETLSNEMEKQVQVSPFPIFIYLYTYITIINPLNNFKLSTDLYVTHTMLILQKISNVKYAKG